MYVCMNFYIGKAFRNKQINVSCVLRTYIFILLFCVGINVTTTTTKLINFTNENLRQQSISLVVCICMLCIYVTTY